MSIKYKTYTMGAALFRMFHLMYTNSGQGQVRVGRKPCMLRNHPTYGEKNFIVACISCHVFRR